MNLRQTISGSALPLLLLIISIALLLNPILDFSQLVSDELLPDGVFSLILGIVLLAGGILSYWSNTGSDG
ncbi:hypothetical protein [Haloquadratum walsbyi]|uniref:Uncharacterized protein n=1 Tax=Haloquadratum walsbyi J07HQW2 TaxID=1238425 RepID=U1MUF7_9EURY|nr:hypothetical protein [Haloquadratum walsbyi]ERG93959.1 MAG: hypothetical protein J07HQW2_00393 [Haloquadratum walsbyi J07HQW2]